MQKKKVWTSWEMWRMQETSCRVWTSETCLLWKKEKGMTNEDSGFWKFSKKYLQNNQDYANIQATKKAMKETLIFRRRQEYSVTDWERCLKEETKGTLRSRLVEQNFAGKGMRTCKTQSRSVRLICVKYQEWKSCDCHDFSMRVVPREYRRMRSRPGTVKCSGAFFISNFYYF